MGAQTFQRRDHCFLIHLDRIGDLERRNDFSLAHLQSVGDHTRGLFEAEASIAVSAAHALEYVKVFFFIGHCALRMRLR